MNLHSPTRHSRERGSQIAEAALVLPIFFTLFLAIFWFGRVFNLYSTVNHAAREGARAAVAQTCGACAVPNNPPTVDQVATVVKNYLQASHIDPTQVVHTGSPKQMPACSSPSSSISCTSPASSTDPNICVYFGIRLDNPVSPNTPACGVAVSFQYPYSGFLPFSSLNKAIVTLPADVQMQGEY